MAKKILLITKNSPWQIYAINFLAKKLSVKNVIIEEPDQIIKKNSLLKIIYQKTRRFLSNIKNFYKIKKIINYENSILNKLFSDDWKRIKVNGVNIIKAKNKEITKEMIADINPEIVIVFGTSLLPNEIFSTVSALILNIHWGLSPYYRGTHCTDWAIFNDDYFNIGYTIHKLSNITDGGDVVDQGRPELTADDTVFSIDMKLTKLSLERMVRVVEEINNGNRIKFFFQDMSLGKNYYLKEWDRSVIKKVEKKIKNKELALAIQKYTPSSLKKIYTLNFEQ